MRRPSTPLCRCCREKPARILSCSPIQVAVFCTQRCAAEWAINMNEGEIWCTCGEWSSDSSHETCGGEMSDV